MHPEDEKPVEVQAEKPAAPKNRPLFGVIQYENDAQHEAFLKNMTNGQAIFTLMAAVGLGQAKGSFNLLESETISTAIRTIKRNSEAATSVED